MDRVETRELAYFVAVAEELHFGRAADRLGIAQPPLSRAIQQLERHLGVGLLERTSRRVVLTPAGEVLLHESRTVLDAVTAAIRRTQRAGQPDQRLVLVMKPGGDGGLLPNILDAYQAQPGAIPVDVLCRFGERATMLREGSADVALLHSPRNDLSGFAVEELLVERQVVVLPLRHRLARRNGVYMSDLHGETVPRWPGVIDDDATGPRAHDVGQLMQLIALGRTVAVLPESIRDQLRRDLVAVPVRDAIPTTLVLAWPEQTRSAALAAFVRTAAAVASRSRPTAGV